MTTQRTGRSSSHRALIVAVAALVCAGFAVAWYYLALSSLLVCGGDGGVPYVADDSTLGGLCDAREDGPVLALYFLGVLLAPAVMFTGAIIGAVRGAWRTLGLSAVVGLAILGLTTVPFLALPSRCSPEQEAAGADCEHY